MSTSRNKRVADEMARASLNDQNDHNSKKPRFDARNPSTLAPEVEEEDAILELDEIGRGGLQSKRNAVRLEGYESDSSNENFDARAAAKAEAGKSKEAKSKDEEDNDMFADLEEEDGDDDEDLAREGKKPKEVRFMDENEIEGQVVSSKSGGHVSADFSLKPKDIDKEVESSSDDSGDEEERAKTADDQDEELGAGAKKHRAPKLDAFNMREENEEGRFDESGNYVRKATDPYAVHDSWLEGSSKSDMKRAKEAQEKREADRRERDRADDSLSMGDLLSTLIIRMEKGESVLEALARLGRSKEKKKPKWQKNRRKADQEQMDIDEAKEDAAESKRKETVETITAAADQILTRGQNEIYDAEREMLIRQYKRETGDDWEEPLQTRDDGILASKQWEYRWSDARDGGQSHGPYDGGTMRAWNDAGFFSEGVEFREVDGDDWRRTVDFV